MLPSQIPQIIPDRKKNDHELILIRRDQLKSLVDKGITNPRRLATLLSVSVSTIDRDIRAIRKVGKDRITQKAGPDHVQDILGQHEEVIRTAMADYIGIKDNSPRASTAKAQLLQTIQRGLALKQELLENTGIIPQDVTQTDRILEAEVLAEKSKKSFDSKILEVMENDEGRRKVLNILERLTHADPSAVSAVNDALKSAVAQQEAAGDSQPGRTLEDDKKPGGNDTGPSGGA
jgi:hypothetical protein